MQPDGLRHGTVNAYRKGRCRCVECRRANTDYFVARRKALSGLPLDDERHGTVNGYVNWKCRCVECRRANTEYRASRRWGRDNDLT